MFPFDAKRLGNAQRWAQFFALPEIGSESHDLALIFLLQPFQNDAGIKPSGKDQNHAV